MMAPFSKEQVDGLNKWQENGMMHPFTCPNDGDDAHIKHEFEKNHRGENYDEYLKAEKAKGINYPESAFNETSLIATEKGWVCPVCDYTQNWAHDFMVGNH